MDDSLSGTTAVAVYLEGRDMWVANVGDSRAIVVQEHEGKLVARPLSSDQTPYRKVNGSAEAAVVGFILVMLIRSPRHRAFFLKCISRNEGNKDLRCCYCKGLLVIVKAHAAFDRSVCYFIPSLSCVEHY